MTRTFRLLSLFVVIATAAWALSVDTVAFRATLTTDAQVPPVTGVSASGSATVLLHLTRVAGQITVGVVDFDVDFTAQAAEIIGLSIQNGPAGSIGDIVVSTDLSAGNRFTHSGGLGRITRQVVVRDRSALLNRILNQPDQLYVNLRTTANPDGLLRGQLARAEVLVLRSHMSPLNEVPPFPDVDASGSNSAIVLGVRDAAGQIVSGVVRFDVNYRFGTNDGTFTGLHFHNGPAGINAGVVIAPNPGLAVSEGIPASGQGSFIRSTANITSGAALTALRNLFAGQAPGHYTNMHTTIHGGGVIRGQLQYTGVNTMRTDLSPGNVTPPVTGLNAEAPATITAYVTRNQAGRITSGTLVLDVNYEFPEATEFLGLHIHRGAAGVEGPIVINSGIERTRGSAGNFFRSINVSPETPEALEALNGLLANPDRYYLDIHTTAHPNGALRNQLSGPFPVAPPSINANGLVTAVLDPSIAAASPGALVTIFGQNLIKTPLDPTSGLGMDGPYLPITLNGTEVRIGGRQAALSFAGANQINAQVPYEIEPGNVQVFVGRPGDVLSAPFPLLVTPFSPGIFVTPFGAAVLKNADFSLVTSTNPAAAGEVLSIFGTGLGAVTPQVGSGQFAPSGPIALTRGQPSVTIGGRDAEVLASALAPGFVGLYQVAVRMPAGVASGNQPVVITIGGLRSNAALMAVR